MVNHRLFMTRASSKLALRLVAVVKGELFFLGQPFFEIPTWSEQRVATNFLGLRVD